MTAEPLFEAVIATEGKRDAMLAAATASFEAAGIAVRVVYNDSSCGTGWRIGLEESAADYVLLATDDLEVVGSWDLVAARQVMGGGKVIRPRLVNADGSPQRPGGRNICAFPFARRNVLRSFLPWPETRYYGDVWITEAAQFWRRGPVAVPGIALMHKIAGQPTEEEYREYLAWRDARIAVLARTLNERMAS